MPSAHRHRSAIRGLRPQILSVRLGEILQGLRYRISAQRWRPSRFAGFAESDTAIRRHFDTRRRDEPSPENIVWTDPVRIKDDEGVGTLVIVQHILAEDRADTG